MTFPAIPPTFKAEVEAGRLHRWMPPFADPDFVARRTILMTQEAWQQCPPEGRSANRHLTDDVLANTRVALERFISGQEVEENLHIKCLQPQENGIWTLRVVEQPQVRLFGWFGSRDVFIVSHIEKRNQLQRGKQGSRTFAAAIGKAMKKRDETFTSLPWLNFTYLHACLSNGVSDEPEDDI